MAMNCVMCSTIENANASLFGTPKIANASVQPTWMAPTYPGAEGTETAMATIAVKKPSAGNASAARFSETSPTHP